LCVNFDEPAKEVQGFDETMTENKGSSELLDQHSKVVLVVDSIPNMGFGGGDVTSYAIAHSLIELNYNLVILVIKDASFLSKETLDVYTKLLEQNGAEVVFLKPQISDETPECYKKAGLSLTRAVEIWANYEKPDLMIAYHWDAAYAISMVQDCKKIALVGDPIHLPTIFRNRYNQKGYFGFNYRGFRRIPEQISKAFKKYKQANLQISVQTRAMVSILDNCDCSGAFAAHHARWLDRRTQNGCSYFRTPVKSEVVAENLKYHKDAIFRILLIGHLKGTATIYGLRLFFGETLPTLLKEIKHQALEVRVVGGFFDSLPDDLKKQMLSYDCVKIMGQVVPADQEFLNSDLVVVPTPIKLGIRVRIITAFSFGCAVVTHISNKAGIPELVHKQNCMLSTNGRNMAKDIATVMRSHDLKQKIGLNAFQLFEEKFSVDAFKEQIGAVTRKLICPSK
jgi:glycosyltransferase involved in cell wall biosynthesis